MAAATEDLSLTIVRIWRQSSDHPSLSKPWFARSCQLFNGGHTNLYFHTKEVKPSSQMTYLFTTCLLYDMNVGYYLWYQILVDKSSTIWKISFLVGKCWFWQNQQRSSPNYCSTALWCSVRHLILSSSIVLIRERSTARRTSFWCYLALEHRLVLLKVLLGQDPRCSQMFTPTATLRSRRIRKRNK